MSAATIRQAFDSASIIPIEGPRPLYRELPGAEPFPVDALGTSLSRAARAIEGVVQCPMACAANSVLAVASLAAQGRANIILPIGEGKPAPLSLYLLTVLESGERKSTADSMALKPVRDYETELSEMGVADRASYSAKIAAHEASAKHLTSTLKKDRAALEAALIELGPAPQPPLLSLLAPGGDQTMEGLFRIYQNGHPSLAMLCDDAASFLGGHSLKAEQKVGTTANLCRAWDGSKLERVRGGDGVSILHDRRLAMHLMVQAGVAAEFMSDDRFADQGLLARFLVSAPEGRAGTRFRNDVEYVELSRMAASNLAAYNEAVLRLLRQPIRWKSEVDRSLGVELSHLKLTAEARAVYIGFSNAVEQEMGLRGSLSGNKAFASKLAENAARIAGVLALMDDPDCATIDHEKLSDGTKLANFYLSETQRLTAAGMVDPSLRQANVLKEWLAEQSGEVVGLRTIYQLGPNAIRQASKARDAMRVLTEHGWAAPIEGGAEIDGKMHKEAWRVVKC